MLMKVFPHGTEKATSPAAILYARTIRGETQPAPGAARRARYDPRAHRQHRAAMEITSGVLSWHPDEKMSEEQEEEVMDAFEQVAFAGLEADQRNILWVRHTHAGHHELHFLIPRMELSSGKDFNACPPGWQKTLMFSAISSTGAKAGRGRTIRRERGMNFQKRPTCSRRGWRDGARKSGKATATGQKRSFTPFSGKK